MIGMDQVRPEGFHDALQMVPPDAAVGGQLPVVQGGPDGTGIGHDITHSRHWEIEIRRPCTVSGEKNRPNRFVLQVTQNRLGFAGGHPDDGLLIPADAAGQPYHRVKGDTASGA